jgi:hypothetical protein
MREPDMKAEPRARRGSSLLVGLHANPAASGDRAPQRLRVQAAITAIIPICGCRQEGIYTPDGGRTWRCAGCWGVPNLGAIVPTLGSP